MTAIRMACEWLAALVVVAAILLVALLALPVAFVLLVLKSVMGR